MDDTENHSVLNVSQQPSMDRLDNSLPCEPPTGIGFLDLPYELRLMVYHYFIPRNYEILLNGNLLSCEGWIYMNDHIGIFGDPPHPFLSILLVSKQVSEESLDVLYGDNFFVYELNTDEVWNRVLSYDGGCPYEDEPMTDPFLSLLTAKNRGRIRHVQYIIMYWRMPSSWRISDCVINALISPGSIRFSLSVFNEDLSRCERDPFHREFWCDVFDRLEAILTPMRPRLKHTKVLIDADLPIDGKSMEIVLRKLNMYLPPGYDLEICEEESDDD